MMVTVSANVHKEGITFYNYFHSRPLDLLHKWLNIRAQRLINLEIPVLVRSLKSSNIELG